MNTMYQFVLVIWDSIRTFSYVGYVFLSGLVRSLFGLTIALLFVVLGYPFLMSMMLFVSKDNRKPMYTVMLGRLVTIRAQRLEEVAFLRKQESPISKFLVIPFSIESKVSFFLQEAVLKGCVASLEPSTAEGLK